MDDYDANQSHPDDPEDTGDEAHETQDFTITVHCQMPEWLERQTIADSLRWSLEHGSYGWQRSKLLAIEVEKGTPEEQHIVITPGVLTDWLYDAGFIFGAARAGAETEVRMDPEEFAIWLLDMLNDGLSG